MTKTEDLIWAGKGASPLGNDSEVDRHEGPRRERYGI